MFMQVEAVKKRWLAEKVVGRQAIEEAMPPLVVREPTFTERWTEAFEMVVAEAGPHHYYLSHASRAGTGCRYVWDGKPDCLVGRIMVKMGVSLGWLSAHEGNSADFMIDHAFGGEPGVKRLGEVMRRVQVTQDAGGAWGLCLSIYRNQMIQAPSR